MNNSKKIWFKAKSSHSSQSEMIARPKKLWFRAKRYGWGWTPTSWEGWLIMIVYILFLMHTFRTTDAIQHSGSDTLISFAPRFIIATVILLVICYSKGEKPGWQWGK